MRPGTALASLFDKVRQRRVHERWKAQALLCGDLAEPRQGFGADSKVIAWRFDDMVVSPGREAWHDK